MLLEVLVPGVLGPEPHLPAPVGRAAVDDSKLVVGLVEVANDCLLDTAGDVLDELRWLLMREPAHRAGLWLCRALALPGALGRCRRCEVLELVLRLELVFGGLVLLHQAGGCLHGLRHDGLDSLKWLTSADGEGDRCHVVAVEDQLPHLSKGARAPLVLHMRRGGGEDCSDGHGGYGTKATSAEPGCLHFSRAYVRV